MRGDGDGWQVCTEGHRHWGRYGAAGLLVHADGHVLLQHRATWSHYGGTWGLLGGARDSQETPEAAALREATEEGGIAAELVEPTARYVEDHGSWSYSTVLARAARQFPARATGAESIEVRWVPFGEVAAFPLHPSFAAAWPALRTCLHRVVIVVDAANVVGARPDGWWRDRPGAARRLRDRLAPLAAGIPAPALEPLPAAPSGLTVWFPELLLVVEGAARPVARDEPVPGVAVVGARGSGDDEIVTVTGSRTAADRVLVVTADRGLRERCAAEGASVAGPNWLYGLLDEGH